MTNDAADGTDQPAVNPVPDHAMVHRRIHRNDVDASQPLPILPRAFRPSSSDTDGLSVYLDDKLGGPTPARLAAFGRGGADSYVVIALRVSELRRIGLTVIEKADPDNLPGHAVIPELNVQDYRAGKQSKQFQKTLQLKLSELARTTVVFPPDFPDGT